MILFFVFLIGIFEFCEGSVTDLEFNIVITKINVDSFEEENADFIGMNIMDREYFCEKLRNFRLYPFEPLPLTLEYFRRPTTIDNFALKSLKFQDIPSSSSSEPIQNSLQFQDIEISSQHQDPSSFGTLEDFVNLLIRVIKETRKVVDTITIGSKRRKVPALPCILNKYTIYVVPVVEFDGALLFLHNGSSSPMPLGILVPLLRFSEANVIGLLIFDDFFVKLELNYKKNRIIAPLKEETPDPLNTLNTVRNLTLCTSLFYELEITFIKKQSIKLARMEYEELELFNALRCYHTGNFEPYIYQLSEIPRIPLSLLMIPQKSENLTTITLYEVFSQNTMTKKNFYFKGA